METFNAYYRLVKPGIIRGNIVHTLAGVLFASTAGFMTVPAVAVLVGTAFVIASACVINNFMDRSIDARMARTKSRASVTGQVGLRAGTLFATVLFMAGFGVLTVFTNPTVVGIGLLAYVSYTAVYGWAKRTTTYSTLIGAVPGALPLLGGYAAITGRIDLAAALLFLLVFIWQLPHFYAISLFRKKEYAAAGIPVLGVVKPFERVRASIIGYIVAYVGVVTLIIASGSISPISGLLLLAGAAFWLYVGLRTPNDDRTKWAKSVFGASLVLALLLLVAGLVAYVTMATPYGTM